MQQAISLAERGLYTASPNPRVGCVLVKDGQVIGRGWHRQAGLPHAEIEALNDCATSPEGATAYVTLEPCSFFGRTPPCTDALLEAGIAKVIVGGCDPHPKVSGSGLEKLKAQGVDVSSGCEMAACAALNPGLYTRHLQKRPFVRLKMAMSLDGRTALANGESQWITGEAARADVQHWRARADCILTGIGTVLADDPQLTMRLTAEQFAAHGHAEVQQSGAQQPTLAIVDSQCRTPVAAKLLQADRSVLIYAGAAVEAQLSPRVEVVSGCAAGASGIDLHKMLADLGQREINEIHVEAGARLCASLIKEGLADELLLYIAPHLLGSDAKALFEFGGLTQMDQRINFEMVDVTPVGGDLRLRLQPASS